MRTFFGGFAAVIFAVVVVLLWFAALVGIGILGSVIAGHWNHDGTYYGTGYEEQTYDGLGFSIGFIGAIVLTVAIVVGFADVKNERKRKEKKNGN